VSIEAERKRRQDAFVPSYESLVSLVSLLSSEFKHSNSCSILRFEITVFLVFFNLNFDPSFPFMEFVDYFNLGSGFLSLGGGFRVQCPCSRDLPTSFLFLF
jgi:hypothetical protein